MLVQIVSFKGILVKTENLLVIVFPHKLIGFSVPTEDFSVIDLCLSHYYYYYYIVFYNIYF